MLSTCVPGHAGTGHSYFFFKYVFFLMQITRKVSSGLRCEIIMNALSQNRISIIMYRWNLHTTEICQNGLVSVSIRKRLILLKVTK